mgnify:CR=1 FL=1
METLWQISQKINIDPRRILSNEPMSRHTTFHIGGPADIFLSVVSQNELSAALSLFHRQGIPCFVLGGGSNLLVGDHGIRGAVLDLSGMRGCARIDTVIRAQAGCSVEAFCEEALACGLGGLENFYGLPGTVGGALFMNARCYERDISALVQTITAISHEGIIRTIPAHELCWDYKKSPFQHGEALASWIILSADFQLTPFDACTIASVMRMRKTDRSMKGHYRYPSAGSLFKNNRAFGKPTGVILESLGLKGYRIGDAGIAPFHANIFINYGKASARDMLTLIQTAQDKARQELGIDLEPEVMMVGEF